MDWPKMCADDQINRKYFNAPQWKLIGTAMFGEDKDPTKARLPGELRRNSAAAERKRRSRAAAKKQREAEEVPVPRRSARSTS